MNLWKRLRELCFELRQGLADVFRHCCCVYINFSYFFFLNAYWACSESSTGYHQHSRSVRVACSVCGSVWTTGQSSSLCGKNFNVGHDFTTFMPALLSGADDSCLQFTFLWPWPWLEVTRSVESKTYCFHFLAHFSTDQDEIWCS